MPLSTGTRLRMAARQALTRALDRIPQEAVHRVRQRYADADGPARRALAPAAAVLRHRSLAPRADITVPGDPELRFVAVESRLTRLLYWYGESGYEPGETRWWRLLCGQSRTIVELGANIGFYTVIGAHAAPDARYVAVEANPESAAILRDNLALNDLSRVTVVNAAAVGDDAAGSTVELALPDQERYAAPTGAYLATGTEGIAGRPATRTVTVPTVSAATLLAGADLVKLDIEGMESEVLAAAWPSITSARPVLVVEVLKRVPRLRQVIRDLHGLGYLAFAIGERSLHLLENRDLDSDAPLPRFGSRDVVLVPAEKAGLL
ncbi:FkbM family methyltransferase [Amycolatopsis sp. CA-230715]|uniref:FkbM family methyltransferase n=1 Tax=Amycolatopsis sp. CA-230715 TaxID=2745196 RepID=UPI001C035CCC|nr:FkbM family methyltransferase [Amycolatopsis sp. CA-230715]QWF84675.1 hypothetical protein HUW46_08127 [Amycolatopsis sp. CA-230715]